MFGFLFLTIFLNSMPLQLTLDHPISLEEAKKYDQQLVIVTGFLYDHTSGYQLLASQPNLKSCCIGSKELSYQQLLIENPLPHSLSAIKVEGIFLINPTFNEYASIPPYILKNTNIISYSFQKLNLLFFLIIIIGIFFIFKILIAKKI